MANFKRIYGLDWPEALPPHQIDLIMWQRHNESPYREAGKFLNPVSEHFLRACRALFTKDQLVIHPWFERMAWAYTYHKTTILWGAASCGKSHFAGLALLLDYLTDPLRTYACMVSTTKDLLRLRSLASTVEYLGYLKSNARFWVPFKYVAQKDIICAENLGDEVVQSAKAVIKGVAVRDGSSEDAKASIMGVHLPRVRLCADEFENMDSKAKAVLDARSNMAVCEDYKDIYLFNPQSIYNPGCALSVPKGGWSSVDENTDHWYTEQGAVVVRFDAYQSPGRREPRKYPFLPNDQTIAEVLRQNHDNPDHPNVWTFLRAFPSPAAVDRTVVSEALMKSSKCQEPVIWRNNDKVVVAAFDPAFTADGDDAPVQFAEVGESAEGGPVIGYTETVNLKIGASGDKPVTYQLVEQLRDEMWKRGVSVKHLAVDDSGTQNVADIIEREMGLGVLRFNYAARPPDLPVSDVNPMSSKDRYANTITWLYYLLSEYVSSGHIRGMSDDIARQCCLRRVLENKRPYRIESKKDMKKRIKGRSPDQADAAVMVLGLVRVRLGLSPGSRHVPRGTLRADGEGPRTNVASWESRLDVKRFNNLQTRYV